MKRPNRTEYRKLEPTPAEPAKNQNWPRTGKTGTGQELDLAKALYTLYILYTLYTLYTVYTVYILYHVYIV